MIVCALDFDNGPGDQFVIVVIANLDRCYVTQDIPRILDNFLDRDLNHILAGTDWKDFMVLICVNVGLEHNLTRAPSCVLTRHSAQHSHNNCTSGDCVHGSPPFSLSRAELH
jgi:hypothetical protein